MRRGLTAQPDPGGSIFLYDTRSLRGEAEGWLPEDPGRSASVRARLFRGPRGRLGIVPDPTAPWVRGRLIEVTPAQMPVLDFVLGGVGAGLVRRPVDVVVSLRSTRASAWVIEDARAWRPVKQERT